MLRKNDEKTPCTPSAASVTPSRPSAVSGTSLKFEIAATTTPRSNVAPLSASPCSSLKRRQIDSSSGSASPR
jgi:hypothetical protein